ncbi:uncharacterized protein [Physcomitrium patens]|uniref:Uncharacterized protein n=1 Tax=Physcomitrium patens TaxID=3218 RepID=A0A7I4DAM2_PHYPA
MTNEIRKPEVSERILESTEIRTSEYSTLAALMGMEDSTNARCWQGETELGVGLGFGSSLTRQKESCFSPYAGFEILEKSRSTQLGTPKHHRPGHGVFTCFRHSTLNLAVPDLEPSTPPSRSGPIAAPRTNGTANIKSSFMDEAIVHHYQQPHSDGDLDLEEPTSPVVNCMGQVRQKKAERRPKKVEPPRELDPREKLRRMKSQAPRTPPAKATKSKSCKWKQLMRSTSSSISPSNHPLGDGEPDIIDLGRFSSASCSSEPFIHSTGEVSCQIDKRSDKTFQLMRRKTVWSCTPSSDTCRGNETSPTRSQELDAATDSANVESELRRTVTECEPVFKKLPSLKTMRVESPKWLAGEPLRGRRQVALKQIMSSSTSPSNSI